MPCRSKKNISRANRSIQLNAIETNVISHIESIDNSIIDQLKGSESNHLKQQLITSSVPMVTKISNPPSLQLRRSLREVLADLRTFDCYIQRKYRTIGTGDHDVNENVSTTLKMTTEQTKNANMLNDVAGMPKRKTRGTNTGNLSQTIENETKKTSNIITRTICTRSSKLNTLNNNQEHS